MAIETLQGVHTAREMVSWQFMQRRFQPDSNGSHDMVSIETPTRTITDRITKARESFINGKSSLRKAQSAYDPELDQIAYGALNEFDKKTSAYTKVKESLDAYTRSQIKTHLGERFHTGISVFNYELRDGVLYPENMEEPAISFIKRGKEYRRKNGSTDTEREAAEVVGFEKVQQVLGDPNTPLDSMMLSISPPSGIYRHNFYDIFTLREKEGKRYVEARRYSSGLKPEEYLPFVQKYSGRDVLPSRALDSYFLSNPVYLRGKTPEGFHAELHKEHTFMKEEEFLVILKGAEQAVAMYIDQLSLDPYNNDLVDLGYRAVLNTADIVAKDIREEIKRAGYQVVYSAKEHRFSNAELLYYGTLAVKKVMAACGISGETKRDNPFGMPASPFSVADIGKIESLKDLDKKEGFTCPKCSYHTKNAVGNSCPSCRITKEEFAARGGVVC